MRCIFFTEQPYTDQGSAPGPPYAVPSLFEIGILITEFSASWIRGLWLTAFGKAGFFRCQSRSFRPSRQASGGILFWLLESKGNRAFKKAGKIQGKGETNAFSPLPIYLPETLQFRAAPKNAVHFLYGAVLHRPALLRLETPVLLAALCKSSRILQSRILGEFAGFRLGVFSRLWDSAGCVRIWLEGLGKVGLFGCQSGIRGLWLEAFGK